MTPTHVLHLVSLECRLAQELDGDEIYLRLDGKKIWGVGRNEHMSHDLTKAHCFSVMNFAEGTRMGANGWEPMQTFQAGALAFPFDGTTDLEILEADTFSSDDHIGRQRVAAADAGHGTITVQFENDGAKYALSYRVEPA